MDYKLSVKAKNDLEEIWIYTFKNWSIEQADRYIHQLIDEINYVSKNPNIGKDFGSIRKGYRRVKVVSHLIFYNGSFEKTPCIFCCTLFKYNGLDAVLL